MRTLHTYFGRELLKTFGMTAAALTVLIVMGGGVANLFKGEGVGAQEMAIIFALLTPIAVTLILPVAALFSATITYGRAAIDNEVLACRAAGINIHRILLPPLLLGLCVSGFTYVSWNYMIPSLMRSIEDITRRDLPSIVLGQFQKGKPLAWSKYKIVANSCQTLDDEQLAKLPETYREDHTFLRLTGVTFLEGDEQEVERFGTAEQTVIKFDNTGSTPRVTVDMQGVRNFDATRRQYYELKHQILGPIDIPLPLKRKIKFENLDTLREFSKQPEIIPEIQDRLHGMRREMMVFFLNKTIETHMYPKLGGDGSFTFHDLKFDIELHAGEFNVAEEDGRINLRDIRAKLTYRPPSREPVRVYHADQASIELRSGLMKDKPVILIELLGNVRIAREPASPDDRIVKKPKESLPQVAFAEQPEIAARYAEFDITQLFAPTVGIPLFQKQKKMQTKLADKIREYSAEVQGEIHFRASYSLGAIAIVVIGAVLGIIVRGGQVLTAFGISCVPMLVVIIASIVGRNLADRPDYATVSICVMWGATAFMYLATGVVATKVLKR